jgi:hypothetical protein
MPLDGTSQNIGAIVRISPAQWLGIVRDYAAAKALKKAREADARSADTQCKSLRSQLFKALSGAPSAICGNYVLTMKQTAPSQASLTLANGVKVPWSEVSAVIVGKQRVPASEIASIYGGRAGSEDIEVAGG